MKTLDEVIKALEICDETVTANCPDCPYDIDCENVPGEDLRADALHYLKEYRSDKAMWEADRKGYQDWIEQYKDARDKHQQAVIELKKNPPLTWDELKNMTAKPVWFTDKSSPYITVTSWMLIHYFYVTSTGEEGIFAHDFTGGTVKIINKDYGKGKTWQAYRKERLATGGSLTPEPKLKKLGDDTEFKWIEKNDK